jgi:release factor glutamine methyltransferase
MTQAGTATTWEDVYRATAGQLPEREARWIIEEASGEQLGTNSADPAPPKAEARVAEMVKRRQNGEPLQYVLGSWSFRGIDLMVDRRVLIPRPETEQVVEVALRELDRLDDEEHTVVDLGTGSGAIALSIAHERKNTQVWAVDASPDAVAVAQANLAGLAGSAATRVRVVEGDWWDGLPADLKGHVSMAVSNPPYISSAEMEALPAEVADWEPREALEAGPAGTEALERILRAAPDWLKPNGTVVIELAPHQGPAADALARTVGFAHAGIEPDLAGRPRALVARRQG